MLGNGRLQAYCFDGVPRMCHIRGKMRKKVSLHQFQRKKSLHIRRLPLQIWINTGDVILVGLRDYQDKKADVILKYNAEEARNLKTYGELPENGKWYNAS